jgi:hypothetical protein
LSSISGRSPCSPSVAKVAAYDPKLSLTFDILDAFPLHPHQHQHHNLTNMSFPNAKTTSAAPSREGSLDENLPLYEEFQYSDQHGNALPSAKATPAEIVDFLVHLLVSTDMPVDQARRVAAKWTRGSGQELRSYPPAMYFEIFGKEDGWIIYREVRMALHNEKNKGIWYRYCTCEYSLQAQAL